MSKRGISFYVKIYFKIIAQDIKSKMSYRADFIISTLGMILVNAAGFVTFWILFQNFPSVMGWKPEEILFLYSFSLIAVTPMQCMFDNNWNLRFQVFTGDFIKYCFRPINIFFYFMSEIFDVKGLGQLAVGIIMLAYSWQKLALAFTLLTAVKLLLGLITASLFMIGLMNIASATCFWIINSFYLMAIAADFKEYSRYPITIFGNFFKFIFTFIIPIAFIAYYPGLLFLRPDNVPVLTYISPVFGAFFFWLGYKVWMKGASTYSGTGS